MNNIKHCRKYLQIIVISLAMLMITSCGKQGVISAISDTSENQSEEYKSDNSFVEESKDTENIKTKEVYITLEGGTGKVTVNSPATVEYSDGESFITLVWSSKNYDYMKVDGETIYNENEGGNSTFTIHVKDINKPLPVIADTVAMSTPHEIEYTLYFSLDEHENTDDESNVVIPNKEIVQELDIGIGGEKIELSYASQFEMTRYGDYTLIAIKDDASYLLVPEGKAVPDNIPAELVVLKQPLDSTYLVSSSVMDLIRECGAIDNISLTGTKSNDWCIEEAKKAMDDGHIAYAGKYSAPDYELILGADCNLAIENTMIYHKPEVKDKLEELGIPVLVEKSSYEEHPLGRLEWIKLYGMLYGKVDIANSFFENMAHMASKIMGDKTDVTVAFFYVTTGGMINARLSNDYIAKMIEMSGGNYCLESNEDKNQTSATLNMQMEDFYIGAGNADVLIYNSTIGGELNSIDDLVEKNMLFKDFKAVKEGKVYCTSRNFFQETTGTVEFMNDLRKVYAGEDESLTYLYKLN